MKLQFSLDLGKILSPEELAELERITNGFHDSVAKVRAVHTFLGELIQKVERRPPGGK